MHQQRGGLVLLFAIGVVWQIARVAAQGSDREVREEQSGPGMTWPAVPPCSWWAAANACTPNDVFTAVLPYSYVTGNASKYLKAYASSYLTCSKQTKWQESCVGLEECAWHDDRCEPWSRFYYQQYSMACSGSEVRAFFLCRTKGTSESACKKLKSCRYVPELGESTRIRPFDKASCFPRDKAEWTWEQISEWVVRAQNVSNPDFFTLWGTCRDSRAYRASGLYHHACNAVETKKQCDEANCHWAESGPWCVADQGRQYGLGIPEYGVIRDQYTQCNDPALTQRGAAACNNYTLTPWDAITEE